MANKIYRPTILFIAHGIETAIVDAQRELSKHAHAERDPRLYQLVDSLELAKKRVADLKVALHSLDNYLSRHIGGENSLLTVAITPDGLIEEDDTGYGDVPY